MLYNAPQTRLEAELDFEIYSEAGYIWDATKRRWRSLERNKSGIASVGAAVYSEHPSTEVLCAAYDLKDGRGRRLWIPGMPSPADLFAYIAAGGLVEAHNSGFEFYIWKNVCNARMGWPPLPLRQLRCSMAKARAWSLPGALNKAIKALNGPGEAPAPSGPCETPAHAPTPQVWNKDLGGWPPDAVYVGRGSKYGNPFTIGVDGDRDSVCAKYEQRIEADLVLKAEFIRDLGGRDLVCFCAPSRCHGDYLLRISNQSIIPF